MGRDPYVPRAVIESGRYQPTGRVRVVEYPFPYPDRSAKIVSVEELGGQTADQNGEIGSIAAKGSR
jgi:hypothetical protein